MKKLISCILALLLLSTAALAVPGDSCVVLGEELTLGETDGIFAALGVERGADGAVRVNAALCNGCGLCKQMCAFGCITGGGEKQ